MPPAAPTLSAPDYPAAVYVSVILQHVIIIKSATRKQATLNYVTTVTSVAWPEPPETLADSDPFRRWARISLYYFIGAYNLDNRHRLT